MSILIVEDSLISQKVLVRILERSGRRDLELHQTAEAALHAVETRSFDLILADWMLPGLSGVDLVRRVRRSARNATTPVLMVTAHSLTDYVIEALRAGADGYILKPFQAEVLLEKIESVTAARNTAAG